MQGSQTNMLLYLILKMFVVGKKLAATYVHWLEPHLFLMMLGAGELGKGSAGGKSVFK